MWFGSAAVNERNQSRAANGAVSQTVSGPVEALPICHHLKKSVETSQRPWIRLPRTIVSSTNFRLFVPTPHAVVFFHPKKKKVSVASAHPRRKQNSPLFLRTPHRQPRIRRRAGRNRSSNLLRSSSCCPFGSLHLQKSRQRR